jgi:methionine--tRNA ligase beta chain
MKLSLKKKDGESADVVKPQPSPASTVSSTGSSSKFSFSNPLKKSSKSLVGEEAGPPPIASLEIRVGRISNVASHEKDDKLFCMDVDVGEDEPRKIAAGLRSVMTAKDLEGRVVLVLCNVKPKKLAKFESHGAILCASNDAAVKLVSVPVDARVGERVVVPGFNFAGDAGEPLSEKKIEKEKVFERCAPFFKTNQFGVPEFCHRPLMTSAGICTSAIRNAALTQV